MTPKTTNSHDMTPRGVTWLGLVSNLALSGGKIGVGILFGSQAILADGVHSLTDLASDIAVLIGLRYGDRPADPCHPYGHRRMHTLVAMFIGLGLLGLAWEIGYHAVLSLRAPLRPIHGPWPLLLALATIPVKELLYHLTAAVGRRTDNPAVLANAWHHRTDAMSSFAAAGGIAGAMFLGPNGSVLDPMMAAVIAAFLVMASAKLVWSSAGELIDRAPGAKKMSRIANIVLQTDGVRSYHAIRARNLGGKVDMDIHVLVDPDLSVREGHKIASEVRRRIQKAESNVQQVIVHIEPDERIE
ncbi:MAG: cation transporter [Phycisphaerae bacterium]|nr:cation transporter [Phycisphaerae bacterium]